MSSLFVASIALQQMKVHPKHPNISYLLTYCLVRASCSVDRKIWPVIQARRRSWTDTSLFMPPQHVTSMVCMLQKTQQKLSSLDGYYWMRKAVKRSVLSLHHMGTRLFTKYLGS